jgi:hypothetical protein
MNTTRIRATCSIRSRVAFVLAVAESCIDRLRYNPKVFNLAVEAIRDAWRWEEGEPVSGDQLDHHLEGSEEESLAVYGCDPPESARAAVMAVTSAVAYVAWHAYRHDGVSAVSSTIHEVDESVIDDVVAYASSSPGFRADFADCVADYLLRQCTSTPAELGLPVTRRSVIDACTRQ